MPTSVKAFFDQKVPDVLKTSPDKAQDVAAIYLFKINGPDGGTWTVDLLSSPPFCKPGEHGTPQCTVEASYADFDQDRLKEAMVNTWNQHYTDQAVDSFDQIVEARS